MQHDINIEAAKVSVLLSETIDKYQYLTGEERLPSDQRTLREKAWFTSSPLGKILQKTNKNNWRSR